MTVEARAIGADIQIRVVVEAGGAVRGEQRDHRQIRDQLHHAGHHLAVVVQHLVPVAAKGVYRGFAETRVVDARAAKPGMSLEKSFRHKLGLAEVEQGPEPVAAGGFHEPAQAVAVAFQV